VSETTPEKRKPVVDTTQLPPQGRGLRAWLGRTFLRAFDWEVAGGVPNAKKAVLVAAPHTSNWDLPFSLSIAWVLGVHIQWMGKDTIFRFPFGAMMRALGGIPVDRSKSHNAVAAAVKLLKESDELIAFKDIAAPPRRGAERRVRTRAIAENKYRGRGSKYRGVFPIKVNQLREVVEEILDRGAALPLRHRGRLEARDVRRALACTATTTR
jgi:hypothetical protein